MKQRKALAIAGAIVVGTFAAAVHSHFQVLVPSKDNVSPDDRTVELDILFTHPMEGGPVMEMGRPRQFGVVVAGKKTDLMSTLKARKVDGKTAYTASYEVKRPGDHVFYIEPAPYWEPAEQKMIVHYTKVVVNGMDSGEGWDEMVGFPVEIAPLVRPNGLWTGNVFRGVVTKGGKCVPFAEIEVEYRNVGGKVTAPCDAFITQVIKADAHGAFCYAMPRAGWWAFAALIDGDEKMKGPDGKLVDVELGALMWVRTVDMK
jgi:cobalt/nickel transport protein